MKYLCLVYHEATKVATLPLSEYDAIVDEVLDYREALRQSGHYTASNALHPVQAATTLRVRNSRVSMRCGRSRGSTPLEEAEASMKDVAPADRP